MSHRMVPGLAVTPGVPHSLHMVEIPLPDLGPGQIEARVLDAGICGTDREIIEATFGTAPPDAIDLVIGHEVLAEVNAVGSDVSGFAVGDLVSVTVRRGCGCAQCAAGASDFCTRMAFTERGIFGRHGYMTERFVDDAEHFVQVPAALRHIGVLVEPTSVVEKAWRVLYGVQSRIPAWSPRIAVVFGAGPIGLLQTFLLQARGIDVYTIARTPKASSKAAELIAASGATYLSTAETDLGELGKQIGNVDIIVECSGSSASVQAAIPMLGIGGVLVLLSVTGGSRTAPIDYDKLNFDFVTGNRTLVGSVNSNAGDFQAAIADLLQFEELWPGLTERLITHRLSTLDEAVHLMETTRGAIKAIVSLG